MNVTRIGVMIGSPGDAGDERGAITDVILQWNHAYALGDPPAVSTDRKAGNGSSQGTCWRFSSRG